MNTTELLNRIRSVIGPCDTFTPLHIPVFDDPFELTVYGRRPAQRKGRSSRVNAQLEGVTWPFRVLAAR